MAKDYYDILGVGRDSSEDDIKKAYRKLAHEHHPDKSGGDDMKFKEINEAYQVLGNKDKRAQYDRFGSSFNQAGGNPFGGGVRWEDFAQNGGFQNADFDIGDIFGDIFGGRSAQGSRRQQRGADIQTQISVSFAEASFGASKDLHLTRTIACTKCEGRGAEPGTALKTCPRCNGKGSIERVQQTILGQFASRATCDQCYGKGEVPKEVCTQCNGATTMRSSDPLTVKIPGGIEEGQTVRITGQGNAGSHSAPAGDLYLTIHVERDTKFRRAGSDVVSEATLPFSQVALGSTINVPTLDGELDVKVPAGTNSGAILRLKGRGAVRLGSHGRGDHLLTVKVETPKKLSKKAKELLQKLAEEGS